MNASLESLVALETHDRSMHDVIDAHAGDVDVVCGDTEGVRKFSGGRCDHQLLSFEHRNPEPLQSHEDMAAEDRKDSLRSCGIDFGFHFSFSMSVTMLIMTELSSIKLSGIFFL